MSSMGERGPPDIGGLISLKVDNFPFSMSQKELHDLFAEFGEVKDCYIPKDHATGRSKGFGFIRFASEDECERAVKACDNREIQGRALRVSVAALRALPRHGGGWRWRLWR